MPRKFDVVDPDPIKPAKSKNPTNLARVRNRKRRRASFYDLNSRITVWCNQDNKDKFYEWADENGYQYNQAMDLAISLLIEHGDGSLEP